MNTNKSGTKLKLHFRSTVGLQITKCIYKWTEVKDSIYGQTFTDELRSLVVEIYSIHSRNPSSTLSLAPCIVVKGFVGQATNQPQVESGVAAYGDCSPSHCQWSPLRNQAATLETTAQLVKHRSHCDRLPHNDLYVYHMKTIFYCLTITQRTKTFGKIYTTLKIKMTF